MTLDVRDAARDAADRDALVVAGEAWSWARLAKSVAPVMRSLAGEGFPEGSSPPCTVVARLDVPTLLRQYALVSARVPMHLLHPAHTETERTRLADALRRASLPAAGDDERALAIVYTSGTSGNAKGVVLSRRAFAESARAHAANLGWQDDDRWLLRIPTAHIGGLSTITRCLLARRCVVLGDDAVPLRVQIERDRVTIASLVPTQLRRLIDDAPDWRPPRHLRAVLLGGGPAPAELLRDAADRGWPVLTTYGLTETCSQVVTQPYGTVNRGELGSGRPLAGVELRVVDDVIQVRGAMLCSGYVEGAPPLTGDGWLVTGDRGRLDEHGYLHVLGRGSDLIISGGENVDPLEVEAALRDLPGVRDTCVFGVPDREWGERVAAVVVGDADFTALDDALRDRVSRFKLPRLYARADALPLTHAGKVDRRAAAQRFSDRLSPPSPRE
ncbi:MAG TPA: AMP-binding protein [Longimicrobiales bacterium]